MSGPEVDHHLPGEKWEFDENVTAVFEDMLRRSIPQYDIMRQLVYEIGSGFVCSRTFIMDIGCSRGEAMAPFIQNFNDPSLRFYGIEVSEPMRKAASQRFEEDPRVLVFNMDLRHKEDYRKTFHYPNSELSHRQGSLILSILTLQFTPIEYRLMILKLLFDSLQTGGALILVEKVLGGSADLDELLVEKYLKLKAEHGYSQEEIDRKRHSLEGVLVPVTAGWNEEMLRLTGFRQVDCFWRWLNFAGWVAVKGE